MQNKKFKIKDEAVELFNLIKTLDKKVVTVLLSVSVLQTVSWYYTSRTFFRQNFFNLLSSNPAVLFYEFGYWYAGDFFTLFILPFLIIKFILKDRVANYGVTVGDYKAGLKLSAVFIIIMVPVIWFASSEPAFIITYPLLVSARNSWTIFFIYELGLIVYLFAWEFIWRGFMLFGLKEKFGYYAVIIQMIPFLILHNGKPPAETFGAIIGGIALGILAYRTRSIYYCVITHSGVMFTIDIFSTLRYRAGEFGTGINSFIHVLKQIV